MKKPHHPAPACVVGGGVGMRLMPLWNLVNVLQIMANMYSVALCGLLLADAAGEAPDAFTDSVVWVYAYAALVLFQICLVLPSLAVYKRWGATDHPASHFVPLAVQVVSVTVGAFVSCALFYAFYTRYGAFSPFARRNELELLSAFALSPALAGVNGEWAAARAYALAAGSFNLAVGVYCLFVHFLGAQGVAIKSP